MSLVDKLLQLDVAKIKMPEKEIEIKRLSELLGEKVIFKIKAIDGEKYADIQRMSIDYDNMGKIKDIDNFKLQVLTIIEGVVDPNFKDKQLLDHYNCATPEDLVKKLLLAGEIVDLANEIAVLSGFETEPEDVKN